MLTIRPEQLEILSQAEDQKFEQQLLALLYKHFSELSPNPLDPDENKVLDWLRPIFDQASLYGMEYESDYAIFVILCIVEPQLALEKPVLENENNEATTPVDLDEKNDLLSWLKPLLTIEDTSGDIKIALIEHELQEQAENDDVRAGKLITIIKSVREIFG